MVEILTAPIISTARGEHRKAEREAVAALVRQRFGTDVALEHTPDGAPYIPSFDGYISVSHCADMAVVAVSDLPIGVDIDTPRPQLERVARRFLTPREQAHLESLGEISGKTRLDLLLHYWTAKEAVFKCAAIPSLVISEIEITVAPELSRAVARARDKKLRVSYITCPSDTTMAIASLV